MDADNNTSTVSQTVDPPMDSNPSGPTVDPMAPRDSNPKSPTVDQTRDSNPSSPIADPPATRDSNRSSPTVDPMAPRDSSPKRQTVDPPRDSNPSSPTADQTRDSNPSDPMAPRDSNPSSPTIDPPMDSIPSSQTVDPFVCGLCSFSSNGIHSYLDHLKTHDITVRLDGTSHDDLHICGSGTRSDTRNEDYKCSKCSCLFQTICKLHDHLFACLNDGSYIFDYIKRTAFPLSRYDLFDYGRGDSDDDIVDDDGVKSGTYGTYDGMSSAGQLIDGRAIKVEVVEKEDGLYEVSPYKRRKGGVKDGLKISGKIGMKSKSKRKADVDSGEETEVDESLATIVKNITAKRKPTASRKRKEQQQTMLKSPSKHYKKSLLKDRIGMSSDFSDIKTEVNHLLYDSDMNEYVTKEDPDNLGLPQSDVEKTCEDLAGIPKKRKQGKPLKNEKTIYTCKICAMTFEYKNRYKAHLGCHKEDRPYHCDQCVKSFKYESYLNQHKRWHKDVHTMPVYTCEVCAMTFEYKNRYKAHLACHRDPDDRPFHCDQCEKTFKWESHRNQHQRSHKEMQTKIYTCEICAMTFEYKNRYKAHLGCHREDRPFHCDQCDKTYKWESHLNQHKRSHKDVLPFYCEICGKGYVTATRLKYHWLQNHSGDRQHVCPVCGAGFISPSKLKRHSKMHTGDKKIQCDLCGMKVANIENLRKHVLGVHKAQKPYPCTLCDKRFLTNYQLKIHMMKHSGVRPYKCSHCTQDFIERKEFRRHMKKQHNLELGSEEAPDLKNVQTVLEMSPSSPIDVTQKKVRARPQKPRPDVPHSVFEGSPDAIIYPPQAHLPQPFSHNIEMSRVAQLLKSASSTQPGHLPTNEGSEFQQPESVIGGSEFQQPHNAIVMGRSHNIIRENQRRQDTAMLDRSNLSTVALDRSALSTVALDRSALSSEVLETEAATGYLDNKSPSCVAYLVTGTQIPYTDEEIAATTSQQSQHSRFINM